MDRHTKKCGSTTSPHLDNVDPPHLHISTMWSFHTYTFDNLTYTLSSINSIFSQSLKLIVAWYIRYDSFQRDYPPLYTWRGQGHIVYKFQDGDGGHLGKKNGTITAILNLNVAWMHTTKCSVEKMSSLHLQDDGLTS